MNLQYRIYPTYLHNFMNLLPPMFNRIFLRPSRSHRIPARKIKCHLHEPKESRDHRTEPTPLSPYSRRNNLFTRKEISGVSKYTRLHEKSSLCHPNRIITEKRNTSTSGPVEDPGEARFPIVFMRYPVPTLQRTRGLNQRSGAAHRAC